jgi:hypothetical protein
MSEELDDDIEKTQKILSDRFDGLVGVVGVEVAERIELYVSTLLYLTELEHERDELEALEKQVIG